MGTQTRTVAEWMAAGYSEATAVRMVELNTITPEKAARYAHLATLAAQVRNEARRAAGCAR